MTVPVECPACSGRDAYQVEEWPAGKRARAMACPDCGLLFLHATSARESRRESSGEGESSEAIWWLREGAPATKKNAALALMAVLDRHLEAAEPPTPMRVLGVGSGAEAWLDVFKNHAWETFGIGRAAADEPASHRRLPDLPRAPAFDLVIAYRLLERVARPVDALRALARTIRPGGICFVSVPRLDTLAVHRQAGYCLRPGKHVSAFTESCLRGLMARAGLEVVAVLHDPDDAGTRTEPLVLRLVARRTDRPGNTGSDPAAALEPVLRALRELDAAAPLEVSAAPAPSTCPGCDSARVHVVDAWSLPTADARAASCHDCGLLFVWPQPLQQMLEAYYAPDGGWSSSRASRRARTDESTGSARHPLTAMLPELDRFLNATAPAAGARVFDFGCGAGRWLDGFQDHGWETYGLEPSSDVAFQRHRRLLAVPSEPQFDLIVAYHVLEHLPRPLDSLRELAAALLSGGHLFVSVPRLDTLAIHRQVDYCLHPRHHIVGFTEACLRGLLARAGLETVASFHALDSAHSMNLPVRLQLLARKTARVPAVPPDARAALNPVIEAFVGMKSGRDRRLLRARAQPLDSGTVG